MAEEGNRNGSVAHHARYSTSSTEMTKDSQTLSTGATSDRQSIQTSAYAPNNLRSHSDQVLNHEFTSGHALRPFVEHQPVDNPPPYDGVVISAQVAHILGDISNGQTEAIKKLRALAKDGDRSRRCVASSNADVVVASAFCANCTLRSKPQQPVSNTDICEDAIAALAEILPLNAESRALLTSFDALRCITWILRHGDPQGRHNAVLVLQELTSGSDGKYSERIGAIDGLAEGLVQVVKEATCPAATKASLAVTYRISGGKRIRVKVVEAGAIPVLLEILPEADRSTCERVMACLSVLCNSNEGRSAAETHALAIPVIVKKLLRVSQLTTEFAVSILWTICHNSSDNALLVNAVEMGAFQKLVVLLQTGCTEKTRERAAQLIKLLNDYRHHSECPHAMDS